MANKTAVIYCTGMILLRLNCFGTVALRNSICVQIFSNTTNLIAVFDEMKGEGAGGQEKKESIMHIIS